MLVGRPFSTSSQGNDNSEDRRMKEAIKKMLYLGGVFVFSDVIPWIEWLDIGGHIKSMKKAGKELDEVLGQWLQEHIQKAKQSHPESEAVHDFMDVMLSTKPETGEISGHKRDAIIKSTTAVLKSQLCFLLNCLRPLKINTLTVFYSHLCCHLFFGKLFL